MLSNLATLPMRHEADDIGWSSTDESDNHDDVEGDADGGNEKQNEHSSMGSSKPVKGHQEKIY